MWSNVYGNKTLTLTHTSMVETALKTKHHKIWSIDNIAQRGKAVEDIVLGMARTPKLHWYFTTIDHFDFRTGTAISVKSMNLVNGYPNSRIYSNIKKYIKHLHEFNGFKNKNIIINPREIKKRVLELVIPKDCITEENVIAFERAFYLAQEYNIEMNIRSL